MNTTGCSLVWGHPQGPTLTRSLIEGLEEAVSLGGGYVLLFSCAAGDVGIAAVFETLGLGSVLDLIRKGRLPVSAGELVDRVFGAASDRGAFVVSGANGIVGAGKTMQLGSRLEPFGVPIVALDFPGVPDGIGAQYPGLVRAFGADRAAAIMGNVVRLAYDGSHLPSQLDALSPRFLLEAVHENLEIKRAH